MRTKRSKQRKDRKNEYRKMSFEEMQDIITNSVENEGNNPLYIDGFEGGLIGFHRDDNGDVHAVYSEEKMLEYWAEQNIDQERKDDEDYDAYSEALDFYEYNTVRALAYLEERNRPIIVNTFD